MPTKLKIKIKDNPELRVEIDNLYEKTEQVLLAQWSLSIAKHILAVVNMDASVAEAIASGFRVNELWQEGKARIHDVRQAGFKVHQIARHCNNEIQKTALRAAGQAIASGHMREHAMVASDYAIKTMDLLHSDNMDKITAERVWQLDELKRILLRKNFVISNN